MPTYADPETLDAEILKVYDALQLEGTKVLKVEIRHYDTALKSYDPIDLIFEQYKDSAVSFIARANGATAYLRITADGEKLHEIPLHYEVLPEGQQTNIRSGQILKVLEAATEYIRTNADDLVIALAP